MNTFDKIQHTANSSMKRWQMTENNDRILVGLSGGKDSLALVEILAERQKIFVPHIEVVACHVSISNVPYQSDTDYLKEFCEVRGVRFVHEVTSFDEDTKQNRSKCWLCSWSRRKRLFKVAEREQCNKLALGHHKDDIVETLLMNEIFTGRFESIEPVMRMEKFPLTVIRPLCEVREQLIAQLAIDHGYMKQIKNCPYEQEGNRPRIKALLKEMTELNPEAYESLFAAFTRKLDL